jgi:hypothetical protein
VRDQASLLIRPAAAADLQKILDLYAQPDFDDGNVLPLETASQLLDRFGDYPDYTLYLAERGGDVVGSFALLVMHNLGHLGAPSAVMEDVVVAPGLSGTRPRKGHDAIRSRLLSLQGLLQVDAGLERQARARSRLLRIARIRAPRVQLPRGPDPNRIGPSRIGPSRIGSSH